MKKYKVGDVLIRRDGEGIRVIVREESKIIFLGAIRDHGTVDILPHFKNMVYSNFYEKVDV